MKVTNCQKNTGCLMRVAGRRLLPARTEGETQVPGDTVEIDVEELTPFRALVLLKKHSAAMLRLEFTNKKEEDAFRNLLGKKAVFNTPQRKPLEEAPRATKGEPGRPERPPTKPAGDPSKTVDLKT